MKKKCCGKYEKKGKHCGSCPVKKGTEKCKPNKDYCKGCEIAVSDSKKSTKKKTTKKKSTKKVKKSDKGGK